MGRGAPSAQSLPHYAATEAQAPYRSEQRASGGTWSLFRSCGSTNGLCSHRDAPAHQQVPGYAASEDHSSLRMFSVATGGSGSGRKAPAAEGRFCSPPEPGASTSNEPTTWIGDEHPDRLRTSGYLNNLSGCVVPIRMRRSYPDAPFLSRCVVPIQMSSSYPEQRFLSRTRAGRLTPPIAGLPTPPRASSAPPQHAQPIRIHGRAHDRPL